LAELEGFFFIALLLSLHSAFVKESWLAFYSPLSAFIHVVAEIVKVSGNHHKVVVQLPTKYRTVDLAFLRAAEPTHARRELAVLY
jgi:hypothetical protein